VTSSASRPLERAWSPSQAGGDLTQHLTFLIAGEEYAVGILRVMEIIEHEPMTRLPGAPPSIRGVINLRGAVVPVVDLAIKFGLPALEVTRRTCYVIVELFSGGERTVVGLMADAVSQVVDLPPESIEPPPSFGTLARAEYLLGLGKLGPRFALILDLDRLLTESEAATSRAGEPAVAGTSSAA
jgi:purine-binding chemotaxis protein CheW